MPNRWPIASGNWSDSAIWSGSIIPTASDDVYANNRTVTIDQNITITSLRNSSTTGVTQGGRFVIVDNYIVSASTIVGTANSCLIYSGSNGCTINSSTINQSGANFISSLELSGTGGIINVSSSLPCTANANQYNVGITTANQILNFTGSILATSLDSRNRVFNILAGPNTYNILSNITCSGANIFTCNSNIVYINITGSTLSNSTTYIINSPGATSTINITGSIIGPFLSTSTTHTTTIRGLVRSNSSTAVVADSSNGFLTIYGPISSSISGSAITSTGTGATNIFTGPFYNTGSFNAVYAYRIQVFNQPTRWTFDTEVNNVQKTLTTIDAIPGVPSGSDVRKNIAYGLNGNITGSLNMPSPISVKQDVLVDNTKGIAIISPEDIFNVLTQNIMISGSIGELLTRSSTVQTVGSTISTFKV